MSFSDYRTILNNSRDLQKKGELLYRFGFKNVSNGDPESPVSSRLYYDNPIISTPTENIVINAACQSPNSIVLWEEEYASNNTNDMFRCSLVNILKALSSVMLFEKLKQTDQFAICLLNY